MTDKEIKKIQAYEAHLWLKLHVAEYDLAVSNNGMDYVDFLNLLSEHNGYQRKLSAWCSVRDLLDALGIEKDYYHPDADKAFELRQKVWKLTNRK